MKVALTTQVKLDISRKFARRHYVTENRTATASLTDLASRVTFLDNWLDANPLTDLTKSNLAVAKAEVAKATGAKATDQEFDRLAGLVFLARGGWTNLG